MAIKIIKNPKGKFARSFDTDASGMKYVEIVYRRRGNLGKLLKFKTTKRIKIPKGSRVTKINNNSPSVGSVKITFRKIKNKRSR